MHKWLIFGDSHVAALQHAHAQGEIEADCEFLVVGGATAIGLRNPNSLTNALDIFRAALLPARPDVVPVMQLGEVDCGFVIWWRAETRGEPVDAQLAASVEAHLAFVDSLRTSGIACVVLTGATLPTILDGQDWGEVANARREVRASLADRIALTVRYNALLRAGARQRRLPFIDISPQLIDPRTGYVAARFRHEDPNDHHLNPQTAGRL